MDGVWYNIVLAPPPPISYLLFLLSFLCIKNYMQSLVYSEARKDVHHFPFHADVDTITEEEERQLRTKMRPNFCS